MRNIDILEKYGCTSKRLKEIFTAETYTEKEKIEEDISEEMIEKRNEDVELRRTWEERIESRVCEGVALSVKNSRHYQAVDLAWDSTPILDQNIPLMMYAQGKIDIKRCSGILKDLQCSDEFCEKDPDTGDVVKINIPRLHEVTVSLVRSYITRRTAAQTARYANLYPFFKYDPRGTSSTAKLKADVLSQRIEIMTDQMGYRPFFSTQTVRNMFLYGRSVVFPTTRWYEEEQLVDVGDSSELPSAFAIQEGSSPLSGTEESTAVKEGVDWVDPHPSRVFWDTAYPLSAINTDIGISYIGYWDVSRFSILNDNEDFFNKDKIRHSEGLVNTITGVPGFFAYYFDPCVMKFPSNAYSDDISTDNDRKANIGFYATEEEDDAVFYTQYFEKVNPKDLGIASYPHDVWVRLTVASEGTVVHAEFLPSTPAAYGGVNENDHKVLSNSMAHDILPFQDQVSNLLSQMLLQMKAGLTQIWMINEDILDDDVKGQIKKDLQNSEYYVQPQLMMYSGTKLADMGLDPSTAVRVIETNISQKVTDSVRAIGQLLSLAERLLVFSPQELGQPAPREISAREVSEIANTTNAIFTSISEGVDEHRAAVKRILYESLICCSTNKLELPTLDRYPASVVKEAGFVVEGEIAETGLDEREVVRRTVIGEVKDLRHDVIFTTRDGAERFSNVSAAQTLTQLLGQVLNIPTVMDKMGDAKLFEILNEVFRLTGSDLNLEPDEEPSPDIIEKVKQSLDQLNGRLATVEQGLGLAQPGQPSAEPTAQAPNGAAPVAGGVPPAAPPAVPPGVATLT